MNNITPALTVSHLHGGGWKQAHAGKTAEEKADGAAGVGQKAGWQFYPYSCEHSPEGRKEENHARERASSRRREEQVQVLFRR